MIAFKISTGEIFADGTLIGTGYAGHPPAVNDPARCSEQGVGPLPCGFYSIGAPQDRPLSVGAFALPLTPDPTNEMFGRSEFFCHGGTQADAENGTQTASDGCIVTERAIREIIAKHSTLQVIV